ncbi:uncharacterized protein LOC123712016 [Pieris brassicae]|uniref:Uncharacterized protein n=1 Tax=Pieris brassicae TaxID=7116 RepID=A0A9P0T2L9_PIEBR|nr:uncharacterized protein LOC123712016 [Pieris brassicae]CAH4001887.1 unnamed protein product [Pieris brassicae]
MQIAVLTCLISLLPAILSAPDEGCPMCDLHNPLRCGPNCLQLDDQDAAFEIDPSREGKLNQKILKYGLGRDLICLNFPPKGKYGRLDASVDGFIINKGNFISLKDLLDIANSNQGYKGNYKIPLDSHRDSSSDMKQTLEALGGIVLGRGGWDKLSPPWG